MTIGVIGCSILTIIGLIFLIIGFAQGYNGENKQGTGIIILLLTSIFGWGIFNITAISKSEQIPIDVEIVMTSKSAIVEYVIEDDNKQVVYQSISDYTMIKDYDLEWFLTVDYNHYNYKTFTLTYDVKDKKAKEIDKPRNNIIYNE